jgi:hypothetical protein
MAHSLNWLIGTLFVVMSSTGAADEGQPQPEKQTQNNDAHRIEADREAFEKEFTDNMSEAVLIGTYTTVGEGKDGSPKPDSYEIRKVSKLKGDYWLFRAKYGDTNLPPLPLKVLWAGGTPVITMDDFTIPLLGTFSFRVMIDGDLYVGTWQHGKKRGHMIGTIRKSEETDPVD